MFKEANAMLQFVEAKNDAYETRDTQRFGYNFPVLPAWDGSYLVFYTAPF